MILVLYSLFGLAADIPQEVLYASNSNKPPSQPIICLAVGRVEPQSKLSIYSGRLNRSALLFQN
jgi:hypothetical protein